MTIVSNLFTWQTRCKTNLPFKEIHPVLYDHFYLFKNRLEQLFKKLQNEKGLSKNIMM